MSPVISPSATQHTAAQTVGPRWRVVTVKMILAAACLAGFLLSPNLWVSTRLYPLSPVIPQLPTIAFPLDYAWYYLLLGLLIVVFVVPRPRWPLVAFIASAGLLGLWDQTRWQPWFYQYLFMFAALVCYPWNSAAKNQRADALSLNACRFIVASIYFWSGVQKYNASFVGDVYPWLIEPLLPRVPAAVRPALEAHGLTVPFLEAGIGLGLLVRPTRHLTVVLAVLMHLGILYVLGPWGHNWNTIVWPWNLAMMAFVVVLFWRTKDVSTRDLIWPGGRNLYPVVLVLFGIMPLFSFWGFWDQYLSAALYSGNTLKGEIGLSTDAYERLPPELQARASWNWEANVPGMYVVDLTTWAFEELNVPPYPARRVYLSIAQRFAPYAKAKRDVVLGIQERPGLFSMARVKTCYDLHTGRQIPCAETMSFEP